MTNTRGKQVEWKLYRMCESGCRLAWPKARNRPPHLLYLCSSVAHLPPWHRPPRVWLDDPCLQPGVHPPHRRQPQLGSVCREGGTEQPGGCHGRTTAPLHQQQERKRTPDAEGHTLQRGGGCCSRLRCAARGGTAGRVHPLPRRHLRQRSGRTLGLFLETGKSEAGRPLVGPHGAMHCCSAPACCPLSPSLRPLLRPRAARLSFRSISSRHACASLQGPEASRNINLFAIDYAFRPRLRS